MPADKEVYVSVANGNFYTENFKGNLQMKIENGIANLTAKQQNVSKYITSENVYVQDIQSVKLNVRTNLGMLNTTLEEEL